TVGREGFWPAGIYTDDDPNLPPDLRVLTNAYVLKAPPFGVRKTNLVAPPGSTLVLLLTEVGLIVVLVLYWSNRRDSPTKKASSRQKFFPRLPATESIDRMLWAWRASDARSVNRTYVICGLAICATVQGTVLMTFWVLGSLFLDRFVLPVIAIAL